MIRRLEIELREERREDVYDGSTFSSERCLEIQIVEYQKTFTLYSNRKVIAFISYLL